MKRTPSEDAELVALATLLAPQFRCIGCGHYATKFKAEPTPWSARCDACVAKLPEKCTCVPPDGELRVRNAWISNHAGSWGCEHQEAFQDAPHAKIARRFNTLLRGEP